MNLHIKLGLLLVVATSITADAPFYVPQITVKPFAGKLTNSGFTLDEPQCIFQQYNTSDVWLVVALDRVVPNLTVTNLSNAADYSLFPTNHYYHIYRKPGANYPCSDTAPKFSAIISVGVETNCTDVPFCNGPLTVNGPYRVKFVVLNNTTMVNGTRWSEKINLQTGKVAGDIDMQPGRHSAAMIVTVVILSVLLAILLACLIAALFIGSKDICWCHTIDNEGFLVKEEVDMSEYNMYTDYHLHNMYKTHSRRFSPRPNTVYTVFK